MTIVPADLARTITEVHGEAGHEWVRRFSSLLSLCQRRWSLTIGQPFPHLSYNYVAPAIREDGSEVVLKLGVPDRELRGEIFALSWFDGRGAARLIDADPERGILLLELLKPAAPLSALSDDEQATAAALEVMRQLWRPAPVEHPLPSVAHWASGLRRMRERFGGSTGPLRPDLVARAEGLFAELLDSAGEAVVLHGDLHHDNILSARREPWLAVDPKGVIGERTYEVGALLRNPMPQLLQSADPHTVLARRVDQLAAGLSMDRHRVIAWGLAQAVLSAWWSIEDHGYGWEEAMTCADVLAGMKR